MTVTTSDDFSPRVHLSNLWGGRAGPIFGVPVPRQERDQNMAARPAIQTARADFLDSSLYEDASLGSLPRLTRSALLTPMTHAFDLAEGRRGGHAQRVAFIAAALAADLQLPAAAADDVFFAALLHDVGMAMVGPTAPETRSGARFLAGRLEELMSSRPRGGWGDVVEALTMHCELGGRIAKRLGFSDDVAMAVSSHHDCWDGSGPGGGGHAKSLLTTRIVAAADRFESMIDAETSPLVVRRRGPRLVQEMSGSELDPEIATRLADIAGRDEFWLGLYDADLPTTLTEHDRGETLSSDELFAFVGVISEVVDERNSREAGRSRRVADRARQLALSCGLAERRSDLVKVAAMLQDVGTLGIPANILSKPDILTIEEMMTVQKHPALARDILSEIPGFGAAAWWVSCHHERVDGKGYPGMLQGSEVPIEAQIIGVCEAFEALTSNRPYRRALPIDDALDVLRGLSGTRFDAALLETFEGLAVPIVA